MHILFLFTYEVGSLVAISVLGSIFAIVGGIGLADIRSVAGGCLLLCYFIDSNRNNKKRIYDYPFFANKLHPKFRFVL